MTTPCKFLDNCRFYRAYRSSAENRDQDFIRHLCQGPQMENCRVRTYFLDFDNHHAQGG